MDLSSDSLSDLLRVLDLTGVFANAILGGIIARSARLDPVGFAILAIMSGLGGGMIRDVLLQNGPPVALTDYWYVLTAVAGAAIVLLLPVGGRVWDGLWPWLDAVALGCWAAAGAQKTLDLGLGWLPAVMLGTITAVGGGFTRDVVLQRIPGILGGNTLYATCALLASGVLVIFYRSGYPVLGSFTAILVGGGLMLIARWRNWVLPPGDELVALAAVRRRYVRSRRLRNRSGRNGDDNNEGRET